LLFEREIQKGTPPLRRQIKTPPELRRVLWFEFFEMQINGFPTETFGNDAHPRPVRPVCFWRASKLQHDPEALFIENFEK